MFAPLGRCSTPISTSHFLFHRCIRDTIPTLHGPSPLRLAQASCSLNVHRRAALGLGLGAVSFVCTAAGRTPVAMAAAKRSAMEEVLDDPKFPPVWPYGAPYTLPRIPSALRAFLASAPSSREERSRQQNLRTVFASETCDTCPNLRFRMCPGSRSGKNELARYDESPDAMFYSTPRLVTHIDDAAIGALTKCCALPPSPAHPPSAPTAHHTHPPHTSSTSPLRPTPHLGRYYAEVFPKSGSKDAAILDICSSWISHYPKDYTAGKISGLGMNEAELARNAVLSDFVVKDLNRDPVLLYPVRRYARYARYAGYARTCAALRVCCARVMCDVCPSAVCAAQDNSFDVVTNAVSVDYLTKPLGARAPGVRGREPTPDRKERVAKEIARSEGCLRNNLRLLPPPSLCLWRL